MPCLHLFLLLLPPRLLCPLFLLAFVVLMPWQIQERWSPLPLHLHLYSQPHISSMMPQLLVLPLLLPLLHLVLHLLLLLLLPAAAAPLNAGGLVWTLVHPRHLHR
jgi:hypothetical protein